MERTTDGRCNALMTQGTVTYRSEDPIDLERLATEIGTIGKTVFGDPEKVESLYLDTFDWRLFTAGKSLSVRRDSNSPVIEIFENGCAEPAATIAGDLPTGFVTDLQVGDLRAELESIIDVRKLLPCLAVTSTITPVSLLDDENKTILRASVERIHCRRPEATEAVSLGDRIVLKPVRGYEKPLGTAQRILNQLSFVYGDSGSLAVEGLNAVSARPGDYSSKLQLDLDPAMTAGAASRQIHLTLLDAMERNEEGTARNLDSEFLHDFRVAVRRIRSALSLIDKTVLPADIVTKAKEDFRWVGRQTNNKRDLDVYIIDFPVFSDALPESYRSSLEPFRNHLMKRNRQESKKIAALIKSDRYRKIRDGWRDYVSSTAPTTEDGVNAMEPIKAFADAGIWKAYRRLIRDGRKIDDASPPEALHNLRLRGKKLRYLMEFFQSLYPPDQISDLIGVLKKLQNVLGEHQDAETQCQAIWQYANEMARAGSAKVETQMAMGMVAETTIGRQAAARSAFKGRFDEFKQPSVRENFARLFNS